MNYTEENISNFNTSYEFFLKDYSQEELYKFLKNGSIAEKQLACIQIETLETEEQAKILMKNLTGIDGKVRESVSFKLKTFINEKTNLFLKKEFYDILLDSIIDINGNICRNIIFAILPLKNNKEFCNYFTSNIFSKAHAVIDTIENFNYKDRKYVTNKEIFKLYWYLETLSIFDKLNTIELFKLLKRTIKIEEYTIREKSANLFRFLTEVQTKELQEINFDNNFYVNLALRK